MEKTFRNSEVDRRVFTKIGLSALVGTAVGGSQIVNSQIVESELESEFLMQLALDVEVQLDTGHTRIAPVIGGNFRGPRLNGTVHDGGADWITQVAGHSSLDVRITLETDDGALIYMSYKGIVVRSGVALYWRVEAVEKLSFPVCF